MYKNISIKRRNLLLYFTRIARVAIAAVVSTIITRYCGVQQQQQQQK